MQVTETNAEGLRREFKVIVPASDIDQRMQSRLTQLGQQVRLPGFRPGKVPMSILRQRYGRSVMGEVLEGTVNETSQTTMSERGLRPAVQPKIEITAFNEGHDLEYTMAVEVLPEIAPADFTGLELERMVTPADDAMIDEALERLASQQKRFEAPPRARGAKTGDQVLIDFEGSLEGKARPEMAAKDFELELGSNSLIPGFEDELIGAKPDSQKSFDINFPETYPAKEFAGKTGHFDVTVKEVRQPSDVNIDDELGKSMGYENLDGLKEAVRKEIERDLGALSRQRLKRQLLDKLAEMERFEVPAGLIDLEFDTIWKQVEQARKHHLETKDDPNHHHAHDPELDKPEDELKADYRAIAERRVRLGLLLSEVGRANNLQISQEEVNRALIAEARKYPGQERKVLEFFQKNPQTLDNLRAPILEDKVVDFIVDQAKVTERTVSREELSRDPDAPAVQADAAEKPTAKKSSARKTGAKAKKTDAESGDSEAEKAG